MSGAGDRPTRWEYETVEPPRNPTMEEASDPEEVLNDYGDEGWELAGTIDYTGGGTKFLVFKRPSDDEDAEDGDDANDDDVR